MDLEKALTANGGDAQRHILVMMAIRKGWRRGMARKGRGKAGECGKNSHVCSRREITVAYSVRDTCQDGCVCELLPFAVQ